MTHQLGTPPPPAAGAGKKLRILRCKTKDLKIATTLAEVGEFFQIHFQSIFNAFSGRLIWGKSLGFQSIDGTRGRGGVSVPKSHTAALVKRRSAIPRRLVFCLRRIGVP